MIVGIVLMVVVIVAAAILFLKRPAPVSVPEKIISAATNLPAAKVIEENTTNGFALAALKLEKTPGSSLVYVTGTIRNLNDRQRFGVKADRKSVV